MTERQRTSRPEVASPAGYQPVLRCGAIKFHGGVCALPVGHAGACREYVELGRPS